VRARTEIPEDPALPGLAAIRAVGLARAIPALGLADDPVELMLRGYTPGERATFEAHAGGGRFIDWQRFSQGPQELDAGTLFATIWRIGLKDERLASEAKLAEETFLARTAGLLNACAVAWYRAAVLLRLACKCVRRRTDWLAHGHALLREAVRQTEAAG